MAFRGNQSHFFHLFWWHFTDSPHLYESFRACAHAPASTSCPSPPLLLSALFVASDVLSVMHLFCVIPTDHFLPFGSVAPFHDDGLHYAKQVMEGQWATVLVSIYQAYHLHEVCQI